jgi:predicted extracellular nuclease
MKLTLTTFNCENLFNRYAFLDQPLADKNYEKFIMASTVASVANRQGELVTYTTTKTQRANTALAILESQPDILIVNEIENLYTLRNFNAEFLKNYFDRMLAIDGNDPRGIDVGILIRKGCTAQVTGVRTHVDDRSDTSKPVTRKSVANFGYQVSNAIFSRDCLEADVRVGGQTLTLMANHLKAQDSKPAVSRLRRQKQAERVADLVTAAVTTGRKPIVLGDLNTDPVKTPADKSIAPLLKHPELQDPFAGATKDERWTHYYDSGRGSVSRLDYILPHKSLTVTGRSVMRKGLSRKAERFHTEKPFPTIEGDHTEASDHCPVSVVLEV